jgi:hypothetical protein
VRVVAALPHIAVTLVCLADGVAPRPEGHPPPAVPTRTNNIVVHEAPPPLSLPARTLTMRLETGEAVPDGQPNTWVHVPRGFSPGTPLMLTFVFHGFKNCIASYTGSGAQCSPVSFKRPGYDVAGQLERTGSQSIVVIPETSFDRTSAEAPQLSKHGAFRAYVEELLAALAPETGGASFANVRRLALAATSGGYQALEPILADVSSLVTDVLLLDAGYMHPNTAVGRFLSLCTSEIAAQGAAARHHAGIVYTPGGGARPMSEELMRWATPRLEQLGGRELARFRHSRGDPRLEDLAAPLYVLRVDEEHDVVVRRNLGRVIAAAGL